MAKNSQPVTEEGARRLGLSPAVLGYSKETTRNPEGERPPQAVLSTVSS